MSATEPIALEGRRLSILRPLPVVWLLVIGIMLAVLGRWYYIWLRPHQVHSAAYQRLRDAVESLANRRPANVTRNEWSYVIGWTLNGIANCCSIPEYLNADRESHDRFLALPERFERKIGSGVGLDAIDWLWDKLEAISKYGERYSANYRPTEPERLAEADHVSIGPAVP
jgi:hypothetical protein